MLTAPAHEVEELLAEIVDDPGLVARGEVADLGLVPAVAVGVVEHRQPGTGDRVASGGVGLGHGHGASSGDVPDANVGVATGEVGHHGVGRRVAGRWGDLHDLIAAGGQLHRPCITVLVGDQ